MIAKFLIQLLTGLFQVLIELVKFIVEQITRKRFGERTRSGDAGPEDTKIN